MNAGSRNLQSVLDIISVLGLGPLRLLGIKNRLFFLYFWSWNPEKRLDSLENRFRIDSKSILNECIYGGSTQL